MMEVDLAVLADAATVDGSGKLSVLGIFDRIQAREFPARHGRIALVMRLSAGPGDAGEHKAEIRLRDPDGQDVLRLDGQLRVGQARSPDQGKTRIPQVLNLDGVVFQKAGRYTFQILLDGEMASAVPLTVESAGAGRGKGPEGSSGPPGVPIVFAPGGPAEA